MSDACCEHSLRWHHEERGCGYHGYDPEHRCPCLLPFDEALATHDALVIAEAQERAIDLLTALIADHPMWIGDNGEPLDYLPERESRITDFCRELADALRTEADQ